MPLAGPEFVKTSLSLTANARCGAKCSRAIVVVRLPVHDARDKKEQQRSAVSHGGGAEPAPAPNSGSTAREPSRKRGNVAKTLALGIITGASVLFALGVISVGFLAIPIMTAGAAYDLGHALGWKNCSLHAKPREATKFYVAVFLATAGLVTT